MLKFLESNDIAQMQPFVMKLSEKSAMETDFVYFSSSSTISRQITLNVPNEDKNSKRKKTLSLNF